MTHNNTKEFYSVPDIVKNGELALFYNLAYNRLCEFLSGKEKKELEGDFIRALFFKDGVTAITEERFKDDLLGDETYADLNVYLFKKSIGSGNRSATPQDKHIINSIIFQVLRVRDFQSHFYHDRTALWVPQQLKKFLEEKYSHAKLSYTIGYEGIATRKAGDIVSATGFLTKEGVDFLLSFFLTRGEMGLFMDNRERLKQKNVHPDEGKLTDFGYARFINTLYCLREGHKLTTAYLPAQNLPPYDKDKLLSMQIANYLFSLPDELFALLSDEQKENKVQRGADKFIPLTATWMGYQLHEGVAWKIASVEREEKEPEHKEEVPGEKRDSSLMPKQYFTPKANYKSVLGVGERPLTADHKIRLLIELNERQKANVVIGSNNFQHMAAAWVRGNAEKVIADMRAYLIEYTAFMDHLLKPNGFNLDETVYLKKFAYATSGKDGDTKTLFPEALLRLYKNEKKTEDEAMAEIKENIKAKLLRIEKDLLQWKDELGGKPTQLLLKYNKDYQFAKEKQRKNPDEKRLIAAEEGIRAKGRKLRAQKMDIIYKCLHWCLGKRGRYRTGDEKNSFSRFAYLSDNRKQADYLPLITDWFRKLTDARTTTNNEIPVHKKIGEVLLGAQSFDDLFNQMIALTIDRIKYEADIIDSQLKWVSVQGVAAKYGVRNASVNKTRNEEGDRKTQILKDFCTHNNGVFTYHLFLPGHFFALVWDDNFRKEIHRPFRETDYATTKAEWIKLLVTRGKAGVLGNFKQMNDAYKKAIGPEKEKLKANLRLQEKLHQHLVQDAMLAAIYATLNRPQPNWRETFKVKMKKDNSIKTRKRQILPENFGGVKIKYTADELLANDSFLAGDRIKKIAEHIKLDLDAKKEKQMHLPLHEQRPVNYTVSLLEVKRYIRNQYIDSRNFIAELLNKEKEVAKAEGIKIPAPNPERFYQPELPRVTFEQVAKMLEQKYDLSIFGTGQLTILRNKALHADIPKPQHSYKQLTTQLKSLKPR